MRAARIAIAVLALAACAKSSTPAGDTSAAAASPGKDTTSAVDAVAKLREAWVDAAHNQDATKVAAMYTDDAVLVGSDQPLASGRAAIQSAFEKAFPIAHGLKVNSENTDVSGDLAYDFGTYAEEVTPPKGKTTIVGGAYLVVLKKQSDGSWKIVRHMTTTPPKG